jgi:hypothetical protein
MEGIMDDKKLHKEPREGMPIVIVLGALALGCLLGALIFAPVIARVVAR